MSISKKIISIVSMLFLFLMASIYLSYSTIESFSGSLNTVVVDRLLPTRQLKVIADMYAVNIVDTAHKVRSGALSWEDGQKSLDDATSMISKTWTAYEATYLTPDEKKLADIMKAEMEKQASPVSKLTNIFATKSMIELDDFVKTKLYPSIDPLGGHISALIDLQIDVGEAEYIKAAESKRTTTLMLIGFLIAAIIITGISYWVANYGISRPIRRITNSMRVLADGNTDAEVPFATRKDEVGEMASALEVFRQAALTNKQLEADAEENRKQAEVNRIADQERAEAEAAERMRQATSGLATGLKRLASGDLSFQLTEAFAADFEGLRQDFNTSVTQLANTLNAVAQSVGSITTGSQEISDGANDLSKRTEQQAAALEETAAALDEITVNVANSSKRSEEARQVATEANASATQSGQVVSKAVEAMQRIEGSSNEISNIIGVIDEIAFQTNLLALNAGVEAARAGEAGKGFAVVAQEVRELAQRSAKAAKEIKELIQTSSSEVSQGVQLVTETGTALKSIGEIIVSINSHMEAIATSSREQSTGLAEVNIAVNQMDQTTQQNAAMVEESSAAASTLANEADNLRQLISQFNLGNTSAQSEALRQTAAKMGAAPRTSHGPAAVRKVAGGGNAAQEWAEF